VINRAVAPEPLPHPTGTDGYVLLDAVWTFFTKNYAWPTFDYLDRKLYAGSNIAFEDAIEQLSPALLRGLHPEFFRMRPQGTQQLSLTIAGAANCEDSYPALDTFLAMVRTANEIERNWAAPSGEQPMLQFHDLRGEPGTDPKLLTKEVTFAAAALAVAEPCFRGGGSNKENLDWSLAFDRGVRPFKGVISLQGYWARREQVLGPERIEQEQRPFKSHDDHQNSPPPGATPRQVPGPGSQEKGNASVMRCTLHPLIAEVAGDRLLSGQYQDAVLSAFRAIEHRVQTMTGSTDIGDRLMGIALGSTTPHIKATRSTGPSLQSEQIGMRDLFKGAMTALRNPRAHGPETEDEPHEAQEMLVFASFLMRRLDIEDDLRNTTSA
jgi:uncharacterized protein (TIGR02391 family)